jgi:HSP20 family protein
LPSDDGDQWDPFEEMERMREEMDRMFEGAFDNRDGNPGGMFNTDISYNADFDIEEKEDQYIVRIEVAGIDKNKTDIEINNGFMTVSGEYSSMEEEQNPRGFYSSRSIGSFMKTIPLPADADTAKVKTEVKEDIVIVTFPRIK